MTLAAREITGGFSVDTSSREEVRNFYNAIYRVGTNVKSGWKGSVARCEMGAVSPEYQDAILRRINFFRAMAGVPADVTLDADYSNKAQHGALVASALGAVDHEPDTNAPCFTPEALDAADNSNLAVGTVGMEAIEAYMLEPGSNAKAGHRRWLLYPQTRRMGTGDIDPPDGSPESRANAVWFFDDNFSKARPATRDGFVAWPPPGYVPFQLVYPRWSFSYPKADFSEAAVTVSSNGERLPVQIQGTGRGLGENSIVFVPGGLKPEAHAHWARPERDTTYTVSVQNVRLGSVSTNFLYSVTVFDPDSPEPRWSAPALSGRNRPEVGETNVFRIPTAPGASGYEFRAGVLAPYERVEGAESETLNVSASISDLYSLAQGVYVASGRKAFHLAHSTPAREQWFMLGAVIVPTAGSKLRFQSRLGISSSNQLARVQVSLNDGASWRDVYSQPGDESGEPAFTAREASLEAFAGRAIRVRFEYGLAFGQESFVSGVDAGIGWLIDDVEITGAWELIPEMSTNVVEPAFPFVPERTGEFYLDGRPKIFTQFAGEWCVGKAVKAVSPWPLQPEVVLRRVETLDNQRAVYFQSVNGRPDPFFQLEYTPDLTAGWTIVAEGEGEPAPEGEWRRLLMSSGLANGNRGFFRIIAE